MSLLELMLVLALLVVIGSLALPAFQVPFKNHRLRKAGELVRVEWNKARIKAMKTGQIQMFRYAAGENSYQVMPYYTQQDVLEADAAHSVTGASGMNLSYADTQMAEATASEPRVLPEGVVFAQSEVQMDARSLQVQQQLQGGQVNTTDELPPILFYPDGTTSEAKLALTNEYQLLYVLVSLRSLTGVAKVSGLLNAEELQQVP